MTSHDRASSGGGASTGGGASRGGGASAERSRAFYRAVGPTGLAIPARPPWDARTLADLRGLLPPAGRVLDVGCGYGRIALPLAELGYTVTGFDIARSLLRAARREAARRGLAIAFDEGSMTSLPYDAAAFDAVLCLWTAFYELTQHDEQVAALGEMHRVLAPGGIAIVEGPTYEDSLALQGDRGARPGAGQRIVGSMVGGHRMEHFAHDATSLERVAGLAGISRREVVVRDWAGRRRQLLLFRR